jgi:hypothetical protein
VFSGWGSFVGWTEIAVDSMSADDHAIEWAAQKFALAVPVRKQFLLNAYVHIASN